MHLLKAIPKQDLRSSQNEIQAIWKKIKEIKFGRLLHYSKKFFHSFFAIFPKSVRTICFGISNYIAFVFP